MRSLFFNRMSYNSHAGKRGLILCHHLLHRNLHDSGSGTEAQFSALIRCSDLRERNAGEDLFQLRSLIGTSAGTEARSIDIPRRPPIAERAAAIASPPIAGEIAEWINPAFSAL